MGTKDDCRKWKAYLCQCMIAIVCYVFAIVLSTPTFRNLIVPKYETQNIHTMQDLQEMIPKNISLAYTPSNDIFDTIMKEVAISLDQKFYYAVNQSELLNDLYRKIKANSTTPFIWIIWNNDMKDLPYIWQYTIRRSAIEEDDSHSSEAYFSSGFLGIQVAINSAIINYAKTVSNEPFEILIQEMPQTNLMYVSKVRETSCMILLFATCALLPIVLETQALAIRETKQTLKKFLLIYNLSYYEMYIGWIWYGIMSGFPVCILGMLSILFIFRWTGLFITFLFIFMYFFTMLVGMCLVSCFHKKEINSTFHNVCIILFMSIIAMIMFSATYDQRIKYIMGLMHLLIPPLTFLHGLHSFAFSYVEYGITSHEVFNKLEWFIFFWIFLSAVYFLIIVYLQYTLDEAETGFQPWHLIFGRKKHNKQIMSGLPNVLANVETRNESQGLALSFRQVTKITPDDVLLKNVSFDIYRGEYTILTSYKTEYKSLDAIISLIIGIFQPDKGSINILGMDVTNYNNIVTQEIGYVGYCPLPQTLMPDLTVEEHMVFLLELCTVIKTSAFKWNYLTCRIDRMLHENPTLGAKRNSLICDLNLEEYAELCWTMATITDPRIVILNFAMEPLLDTFKTVIYRKIKENIGKRTIIQTSVCLSHSEYANRCFMFNRGNLVCAGTPTFLVSVYGKSYTLSVRLTNLGVESDLQSFVQKHVPGSQLRYKIAHLMVFQIPLFPTEPITCLCKLFDENMEKLHIDFYDLLLPGMEEIHTRATLQFHKKNYPIDASRRQNLKISLQTATYKDQDNLHKICINLNVMWKKYIRFVEYYRFSWCFLFTAAILFAMYFSMSIAMKLNSISITSFEAEHAVDEVLLTVEATRRPTTLVVRSDTNPKARKVAYAYTFSEPDLTEDDVHPLRYVKLHANESMEMYLILQAISEPFHFITKFAYGLDISYNSKLSLKVYYSTLHIDYAAVSRSIGRAFMALLRFETNTAYATIQVTDLPLSLALSQKDLPISSAPFVLPLLLTIVVSFVTILPSLEKGCIRITQVNTANFSPKSYWSILMLFDFTVYCTLVILMIIVIKIVLSVTVPLCEVELDGLFVLLITYGIAAIPHAYLFSYFTTGLISAINYVFTNIVFYEIVLVLLTFTHDDLINMVNFLKIFSPLCSFAFASTQINKVIINNNQCGSLNKYSKCKSGFFHACCVNTCGVFQRCFTPQHSLRFKLEDSPGIMQEVLFMLLTGVLYSIILLLIEYEFINKIIDYIFTNFVHPGYKVFHDREESVRLETQYVEDTWTDSKSGVGLAVKDVYKKEHNGFQSVGGVSFAVRTGEIMTLIGRKDHGRGRLLQLLAGHGRFSKGDAHIFQQEIIPFSSAKYMNISSDAECRISSTLNASLSDLHGQIADIQHVFRAGVSTTTNLACLVEDLAWELDREVAKKMWRVYKKLSIYSKCIGYSASEPSCPPWLTVYEGLKMIGLLRGIDINNIYQEVNKWLGALDLNKVSKLHVHKLIKTQVIRLNLAIAMIGEPQILILDNPTHLQTSAMTLNIYSILEELQAKGHSIIVGTNRMERTLPISQKIAVISNGHFKDYNQFENMTLVRNSGYTVIFHFEGLYQTDLKTILSKYFEDIQINSMQQHIANIQISDKLISWGQLFEKLDKIKASAKSIDDYVVQHMKWQSIYIKIIENDYKEPVASIKSYWRTSKKKKVLQCESAIMSVPLPSNLPYSAYFEDLKA